MPAEHREVRLVEIPRAPSGYPRIQSHNDALEASRLCPADQALGKRTIRRHIQLKEARRITKLRSNLFEWIVAQGRCHHGHTELPRSPCRCDIAVSILRAQTNDADRTHEYRCWKPHSE